MKSLFLWVLTVISIISTQAVCDPTKNRVRIVTEHLPPYQIGESGKLLGGSVGLQVKQVTSQVLPMSVIEVMSWNNAYKIAESRPNTLIFSMLRTPERESKFEWINIVETVQTKLVGLRRNSIKPTNNLDDLKGLRVGIKREDAVASELKKAGFSFNINLVEIVNTLSTLNMLDHGRIDVIPANDRIIEYYCQVRGCDVNDYITVYEFENLTQDFYIAASKGTDPSIINQLKTEFARLK